MLSAIKSALHIFIKKLSVDTSTTEVCFNQYSSTVIDKVKNQIDMLKSQYPSSLKTDFIPVLKDPGAISELEALQQSYVFTPVDKAAKNIALTCRSFYIHTIINELFENKPNPVYKECTEIMESDAVQIHHKYMESISMPFKSSDFNKLPLIYMTPKFHKNPVKFRFIVASNDCSNKPFSNAISKALKKVRIDRKYACEVSQKFDGVNKYWIIDSSQPIIDCVERLNQKQMTKSITTYDFTNLYTSLPHQDIIKSLSTLITDVFNKRTKKRKADKLAVYVSKKENVIWSNANWVHKPKTSTFYFTKELLIEAIMMQLNSTYFVFGNKVFQQKEGIPMGTDDGPEIANLTLHQQEYEYMNKLQKKNIYRARDLNETTRLIDDITNVNGSNKIGEVAEDIYGNVIKLNKENEGTMSANVLDLTITINQKEKTATTSLFDKRRAFQFTISNYPDMTGNVSNSMAYGIISSQLLRYYKSCSNFDDFLSNVNILTTKLLQQSYIRSKVITKISAFVNKRKLLKYGNNLRVITNEIVKAIPDNVKISGRP